MRDSHTYICANTFIIYIFVKMQLKQQRHGDKQGYRTREREREREREGKNNCFV